MLFETVLWIAILIVSLAALVKGADWFTAAAETIGLRLGMSQFLVGVTIVSIGTSLPELASSIAAVLAEKSSIVFANVLGSNIANVLFVLGIGAVIAKRIDSKKSSGNYDIPVFIFATILFILSTADGYFGTIEALLFLAGFSTYIYFTVKDHTKNPHEKVETKEPFLLLLVSGLFIVILGAKFLIDSVVQLSTIAGISPAIISATVVAFGTSVPEAAVTIIALLKKRSCIAIGNIVGSNIFNILLVMGVAGLFGTLTIDTSLFLIGIPALILSSLILFALTKMSHITRMQGIGMLTLYALFITLLFV